MQFSSKDVLGFTAIISGTYAVANYFLTGVKKPELYYSPNRFNLDLLSNCKALREKYWPTFWCYNQHLTTYLGSFKTIPVLTFERELINLEDGGVLALDWFNRLSKPMNQPTLIIVPGLSGGSASNYIRHSIKGMIDIGWCCVVMNYRGMGGLDLRTPKAYCGAYTEDVRHVCKHVRELYPNIFLSAIGFSLGSNILVKYVGEEGDRITLDAAISVANPFDFIECSKLLQKRQLYDRFLTAGTVKTYKSFAAMFSQLDGIDSDAIISCKALRDYDDRFTRIVFGYETVDDYYRDASSINHIKDIRIPTLLINAKDDPIIASHALPIIQCQENPNTILVLTERGGHVAFLQGLWPFSSGSWADKVTAEFLCALAAKPRKRE
eukprot:TRINITY_DN3286_c0_g2_i3.p1 TRINITY_DN3286_c0_g2~~TRINITY_DN3286_c0_g2_i3.p1  ORF type:complete len:380 (-),score=40.06 TRINITY_DN3286_c0_g2_i3:70-1209(-)